MVAGESIRRIRQALGWTQQELAQRSGYCDRLIRKAEKGGALGTETIAVLAEALSTDLEPVSVQDLLVTESWPLRQICRSIEHRSTRGIALEAALDDQVVVYCAGGRSIPFRGRYCGINGFREWVERLASVTTDPVESRKKPQLLQVGPAGAFQVRWMFQIEEFRSRPIRVECRAKLRRNHVSRVEVLADKSEIEDFFRACATLQWHRRHVVG
jgi:transcriptional regulator with XRE-family HTH domain